MTALAEKKFDQVAMANLYTQQHLKIDTGIEFVFHLPSGASEREIRLLEVNNLVADILPLEAIDFGVNRDMPDEHSLCVLDITPQQWQGVQDGKLNLPPGWKLDGKRQLYPGTSA